ncbi:hypothetical protein MKZ38_003813 [Zalerion maritima]|uniref:EKC/KEOPS complex subunit BUD32 n=1 Tax=Zalerion maritima TaxID=339359 RepID=A0AAD5WS39_9PEZI|nr:hypothetical protein MKZ38_003813 [Zalerion maritima]
MDAGTSAGDLHDKHASSKQIPVYYHLIVLSRKETFIVEPLDAPLAELLSFVTRHEHGRMKHARMSQFYESTLHIPDSIRDNETVGAGLSSWVHRLDAVAKCYTSDDGKAKDREIAVYERLGSCKAGWRKTILQYYGVLNGCVVLQFAHHGPIRQYLRSSQHDPPLFIKLRWAEQATDAISFLHSKGVLHCDISCNNIFLDSNLNAMVGDFAGSSIDKEQCLGWYETSHSYPNTEDPSEKSEIFALGSTFYEILAGKKPFEGRDDVEIEQAFKRGHFPSLEPLLALKTTILNCWTGKYQTTDELLQDVKQEVRAQSEPLLSNEHHPPHHLVDQIIKTTVKTLACAQEWRDGIQTRVGGQEDNRRAVSSIPE